MNPLGKLVRVQSAVVVEGHTVRIEFEDGSTKQLDLAPLMHGPIFDELVDNPELFHQIEIRRGTLSWPNGADIDPDVLYYDLTPASMGEVVLSS